MILNQQQQAIIGQFEAFLSTLDPQDEAPPPGTKPSVFFIGGYAGTGKTTILSQIAEAADDFLAGAGVEGSAKIAAPTNKAAKRLREKIGGEATTLHYLLGSSPVTYTTAQIPALEKEVEDEEAIPEDERGAGSKEKIVKINSILSTLLHISSLETQLELAADNQANKIVQQIQLLQEKLTEFPIKGNSLGHNDIIICDESSMVASDLREKIYDRSPLAVVWVGDPGQLDPVKSPRWFEPPSQTTLTQVMRQGAESGVLKLATLIRESGFADTSYLSRQLAGASDVEFLFPRRGDLLDWERLSTEYGDRWLTWRNGFKTRNHKFHTRKLNELYRYTLGFESAHPQAGDRLYVTGRFVNRCKNAKKAAVWLSKGDELEVMAAGGFNPEIADLLTLAGAKATSGYFKRRGLTAKTRMQVDLMERKPTCVCDILEQQDGTRPLFCNGRSGFDREEEFGHPWTAIAQQAQGIHALVKDERGTEFWTLLDPSDLLWDETQRTNLWKTDQRYLHDCAGDEAQSMSPIKATLKSSYGYCISVHQSQGSEWPAITVFWDAYMAKTDPKNAVRWLYTAVTRASERVCIVTI